MKTIFRIILLLVIFGSGVISVSAAGKGPLAVMGDVTYSSLGTAKLEGTPADIYETFLQGKLVNAGVPMVHKEGIVKKFAEEENKFWGYNRYNTDLPEPKYRVDATVNVTRTKYGEDASRQDISITVRIFDIKTGTLIDQATESRRNVNPYANVQIVGPQPTWWERYVSGYAREIVYDDPVRDAIDKASKTIVSKFSELSLQKTESDADRFLRTIEQAKAEQQSAKSEPKPEKSQSDESLPLADDDRPYPRLYFNVERDDPKYNNEICPLKLFYPDDNILVCGDSSAEPEDLINLVNQWRSGAIPGPDGRYNTVDGQPLTVTGEVFQACLAEVASQGIIYLEQQECECRKRLGPQADVWMISGACERASKADTGSGSIPAPAKQFDTPDTP